MRAMVFMTAMLRRRNVLMVRAAMGGMSISMTVMRSTARLMLCMRLSGGVRCSIVAVMAAAGVRRVIFIARMRRMMRPVLLMTSMTLMACVGCAAMRSMLTGVTGSLMTVMFLMTVMRVMIAAIFISKPRRKPSAMMSDAMVVMIYIGKRRAHVTGMIFAVADRFVIVEAGNAHLTDRQQVFQRICNRQRCNVFCFLGRRRHARRRNRRQ